MRSLTKSRRRFGILFAAPWCLGGLIFTGLPLAFALYASFTTWDVGFNLEWAGLANYLRIFGDKGFWRCAGTTILFGLISTPISVSFALVLAVLINQRLKGVKFFRALYFLPVVAMSDLVASAAGSFLFGSGRLIGMDLTVLGRYLLPQWLDILYLLTALLTVSLWRTGIQMSIFLLGLENVPADLYEAAEMDGATAWQKFWWVTIPVISPLILLNVILSVVESFTGLATAMRLVPNYYPRLFIWDYIEAMAFGRQDFSAALGVVWLFLLAELAVVAFIFRRVNRKVVY